MALFETVAFTPEQAEEARRRALARNPYGGIPVETAEALAAPEPGVPEAPSVPQLAEQPAVVQQADPAEAALAAAQGAASRNAMMADIANAYGNLQSQLFGVQQDPAQQAALRRAAGRPLEEHQKREALRRYLGQQRQQESQREALRRYMAGRFEGAELPEGMSTESLRAAMGDLGTTERDEARRALQERLFERRAEEQRAAQERDIQARLLVASMKRRRGGGRGRGSAPNDLRETLMRLTGGDSGITDAAMRDPSLRRQVMSNAARIQSREAGPELQRDLKEYSKRRKEFEDLQNSADAALSALEQEQRQSGDVSGFGRTRLVPEFGLSQEGQRNRQLVAEVRNQILRARSGGAVTPTEASRLLEELGEGVTRTDEQLLRGLRRVRERLGSQLDSLDFGFGAEVVRAFHSPERRRDVRTARGERAVVGRQYSPSRNQTRVRYSDGSVEIVEGRP